MRTLITYFSWSNNTKRLVEKINNKYSFDVLRIERKIPYSSDYDQCAYVEAKEEVEKHIHPAIKEVNLDLSQYEAILLFFPIWWYTIPMTVATFVEDNLRDYKGRVIVFANSYTNDPQYMVNSMKDLKEANPKIKFEEGLFNKSVNEHISFIKKEEIK